MLAPFSLRLPRLTVALTALLIVLALASSAIAATSVPAWSIDSLAYPSDFSPADSARCLSQNGPANENVCDTYVVTATDAGSKPTSGSTVTIEATLPPGLTARKISLLWSGLNAVKGHSEAEDLAELGFCTTTPVATTAVKCTVPTHFFSEVNHKVQPDETLKMWINVTVDEPDAPGSVTSTVRVSGGGPQSGAPQPASASSQNTVSLGSPPFGPSAFSSPALGLDGALDIQAGSHPYELATKIDLNSVVREDPESVTAATTVHDLRDVVVDLPLGLAGSALSAPTCTLAELSAKGAADEQGVSSCPADTIIGHIHTYPTGLVSANSPIYNLVPEQGVAAEFGFIDATGGSHVLDASLAPTPAGYVLRTTSREISAVILSEITANIYGDPAARDGSSKEPVATFTNPSDCSGGQLKTEIHLDSWPAPGSYNSDGTPDLSDPNWVSVTYPSPPVTGCDQLKGLFTPSIMARPETTQADTPTGLEVDLNVPQQKGSNTLATPPLKDAVVTLPAGMSVNPSSANGLRTCSLAQVGMSGSGVPNAAPPTCPDASKIGMVELETPALPAEACKEPKPLRECPNQLEREKTPLEGSIFVANQGENPFGSLLAFYIVINDPKTGVIVKLPAEVKADSGSGQLTTVVHDSPQFPFSELRTHFFGGSTASLSTPNVCGTYTVSSELTPWSAPESGPSATPSSSFEVTQAAGGGGCSDRFAPSFAAGTANTQAGAYTPFSVTFSRQDSEQTLGGVSVTTPPGLLGTLKSAVQCPEPQASKGECGPESLLGEATSAVGTGPNPYWIHGGKVYLTGPYNGGPFGLSIVVPTTAGPYTLTGNGGPGREIVRSSILVDSHTAQITVLSDPLPTIIEGIPLAIRTVNVTINRPGFMFNPSNCSPLSVGATISSIAGANVGVQSPFHATGCAHLPFKPTLTASTQGNSSKAGGARLVVKVTSAPGQANIAKTKLILPIALPSRLTTIQKACVDSVFEANPAACDEGSNIGTATVHTPVLKSPLSGPAYLVSHGGAAFPDVEFVLQGEGITLILDGQTNIKKGVTSSTFNAVPDAPVTTFETTLPEGSHSALTANVAPRLNYSLCGANLIMPTTITGQNGAVIERNTKIAVTGCAHVPGSKETRAQKLKRALKACRKKKHKSNRIACEKQARKKYGPKKSHAKKAKKKK